MILGVFSATLSIIPDNVGATILYVGGGGPGNYTTVQSALDAAKVDDTVFVYNGTYRENLIIGRRLSLLGEDRNSTVIDGRGGLWVVKTTAGGVIVSGFTITNSTDYAIHLILNNNVEITDNNIVDNRGAGILLQQSTNCIVSNNNVSNNNGAGVFIHGSANSVVNNNIHDNYAGISIEFSLANSVSGNNISGNGIGIGFGDSNGGTLSDNHIWNNGWGVYFYYSSQVSMTNNMFQNDGILIKGPTFENWTHTIDVSNTVNGKPVYYWKSVNGGIIPQNAGQVILANCQNVVVENQNLTNGTAGIQLGFSHMNTISNNTIAYNDYFGIQLYGSGTNIVERNNVSNNGRYGIDLDLSSGNTIANNTAFSNVQIGILVFESNGNVLNNNTILNSSSGIHSVRSDTSLIANNSIFVNSYGGVTLRSSNDVTITGNSIRDNPWGIDLSHSLNSNVTNNTLTSNGITLFHGSLAEWNTHTIETSNTVNGRPVIYWKDVVGGLIPAGAGQVILANCQDVVVEDQIVNNATIGVLLGYSSNITIINNTALLNYLAGFYLYASSDSTIVSNNASVNTRMGITLVDTSGTDVVNNNVSSNQDGISLQLSNNNNVISENVVDNNRDGILIWVSHSNTIHDNTVSSSTRYGVVITASSSNRLYHNRIQNNTQQAQDDTSTNQWDDGYPSGGNYWSDYLGPDSFRGPNQDIPGSDGIGDTPYIIDADSLDKYPVVSLGTVYPYPSGRVSAVLSGQNFENVTVVWDPSPDESLGLVDRYDVYRGLDYNISRNLYQQIGSVPNGTHSFIDVYAGKGDPRTYFYIVCTVNITNSSTCADNQAAKFTRPLSKGPNLISIPLIQSDEHIPTVLQTLSYDNAWSYDPINQEWRSFSKSKPYAQSLEYLNHTIGIWVNVTQDSNLTVAGVVPTSTTIDLQAGWNLVGFPSFDDNFTVADLKAAVAVERIEGFDALAPPYFLRAMLDGDFLQAGFGYWIRVESPAIWTVENV